MRAAGVTVLRYVRRRVAIPIHDDNPTERFALITLLIIAINVFVYLAVQPHDGGQHEAN
jgi:hypothetical protein